MTCHHGVPSQRASDPKKVRLTCRIARSSAESSVSICEPMEWAGGETVTPRVCVCGGVCVGGGGSRTARLRIAFKL